jgi:hypothetical protein
MTQSQTGINENQTKEISKMENKEFDHVLTVEGGQQIFLKVSFQADRYVATEPKSGWVGNFTEDGAILMSMVEPSSVKGVELAEVLISPTDKGLFHKWNVWRSQ